MRIADNKNSRQQCSLRLPTLAMNISGVVHICFAELIMWWLTPAYPCRRVFATVDAPFFQISIVCLLCIGAVLRTATVALNAKHSRQNTKGPSSNKQQKKIRTADMRDSIEHNVASSWVIYTDLNLVNSTPRENAFTVCCFSTKMGQLGKIFILHKTEPTMSLVE
ncbi:GTP pyrophosphokinase [Trichinella pseudospiralis]